MEGRVMAWKFVVVISLARIRYSARFTVANEVGKYE